MVLGGTPAPALALDHLPLGLYLYMLMPQLGYLSYSDSMIPDPMVCLYMETAYLHQMVIVKIK